MKKEDSKELESLPEFINIKNVSKIVCTDQVEIDKLISNKGIPLIYIGNRILLKKSDFIEIFLK